MSRRTGGFTLIELLVAVLLVGISVAGVFGGLRVLGQTESRARDVALLQRLGGQRLAALESVEDVTTADDKGDFTDEGYPDITYTLAVEQESDEPNLQRVTVTVERGSVRQSLTQLIFVRPETSTAPAATGGTP